MNSLNTHFNPLHKHFDIFFMSSCQQSQILAHIPVLFGKVLSDPNYFIHQQALQAFSSFAQVRIRVVIDNNNSHICIALNTKVLDSVIIITPVFGFKS